MAYGDVNRKLGGNWESTQLLIVMVQLGVTDVQQKIFPIEKMLRITTYTKR